MRLFRTLLVFLLFFVPLISSYVSFALDAPQLGGYVTDEVGVVKYSDYYEGIIWICETLEQETSCVMAILIVNSTNGQDIAMFATEVFNSNGIGVEGKDNGILIVLAIGDGTYFISVGRGLEGILNDAKVGRFARESLVPYLEWEEYGKGVYFLALDIGTEIEQRYEQAQPKEYPIEWIPLELPYLLLAILGTGTLLIITKGKVFLWIGPFFKKLGRGRSGGGGAGGKV